MALFSPFTCVTLCQFYSIPSPYSPKITNYGMREQTIFWLLQRITFYQRKQKIDTIAFRHNRIFRHTYMYKQHILTKKGMARWLYRLDNINCELLYADQIPLMANYSHLKNVDDAIIWPWPANLKPSSFGFEIRLI